MAFRPDLILLHPPSVYDFRKIPSLLGPVSDVIPSKPIFEMYPIGFTSIVEHLLIKGFETRIINLAYRMLRDETFNAEKLIRKLDAYLFGIDLHWLPHAHGSLEIASLVKKHHPSRPVVMGGIASTYFHRELIRFPQVDFVIRGDSAEVPISLLLSAIKKGKDENALKEIPNLTWKDKSGQVHFNELAYLPTSLHSFTNNYLNMFRMAMKYTDIQSMIPFSGWWTYPITAIMTCRGCTERCVICGASAPAFAEYGCRKAPAFRPPDLLAQDVVNISRYTNGPIFIVGDLRQAGMDYVEDFFKSLETHVIRNHVIIELFKAASREYLERVAKIFPNFNIEMSPESHDEKVRKACGKTYSNQDVTQALSDSLSLGCHKFDLFFMTGMPYQNYESVLETIKWCEELMKRHDRRVNLFISPLAPFLDPGSLGFEQAEKSGYKILFRDLESHRRALIAPSWKYTLNYETQWMDRDQIVLSTYHAARSLNAAKLRHGYLSREESERVDSRIAAALEMHEEIDRAMALDSEDRENALLALRPKLRDLSEDTVCLKKELKWPVLIKNFNYFAIGWDILLKR